MLLVDHAAGEVVRVLVADPAAQLLGAAVARVAQVRRRRLGAVVAHLGMEILAKHGVVSSLEVVEVNPVLDEHNATASLAVELVCSALGARIL